MDSIGDPGQPGARTPQERALALLTAAFHEDEAEGQRLVEMLGRESSANRIVAAETIAGLVLASKTLVRVVVGLEGIIDELLAELGRPDPTPKDTGILGVLRDLALSFQQPYEGADR